MKTPKKLTDEQVAGMRASNATHAHYAALYNVSEIVISMARRGITYKHVKGTPMEPKRSGRPKGYVASRRVSP